MDKIIQQLSETGVIPVVKIDNEKDAVPLANALRDGGINCAEITFRTNAAEKAIKAIHKTFPDMLIIAGTVLNTRQVNKAIAAGAYAIVSPGFNIDVVKYCIDSDYPVIPGIATPTELDKALSLGLRYIKFFPAEAAGGIKMIKAMSAPYSMVRFMPTGGISIDNIGDYLNCKAVFACGGSWMVPPDKIADGKFDEIKGLVSDATSLLKKIRG